MTEPPFGAYAVSRRRLLEGAGMSAALSALAGSGVRSAFPSGVAPRPSDAFGQFKNLGDNFSFAIVADSHAKADAEGPAQSETLIQSAKSLAATVEEINALSPGVDFIVFNGDIVGSATKHAFHYFLSMAEKLKPPMVIVHGNHEGASPYENFIRYVGRPVNKIDSAYFSFDAGKWHFIVFPCGMTPDYSTEMLAWLEKDLEANKDRPTMVFHHEHLLPIGLTQLEFYTHPMPERIEILNLLTKHGNVRCSFCGHVHAGIKSSLKTSWTYRGTNFVDCPTGTGARNFGEEFEEFAPGLERGGYYLVVDVKGDAVTARGRLSGSEGEFVYPDTFREFKPEIEPRWFTRVADFEPNAALVNGGFDHGLEGWRQPYRYMADDAPGFTVKTAPGKGRSGKNALYVRCREKGDRWARDEVAEAYQLVEAPAGKSPILKVSYRAEETSSFGAGYIRVNGFGDGEFKFLMLFEWAAADRYHSINFPRFNYFTAVGGKEGADILHDWGRDKQAMFWELPYEKGQWRDLAVDVRDLFDRAQGKAGAYEALGVENLLIGLGAWVGSGEPGLESAALFDDVSLTFVDAKPIKQTALATGAEVFKTQYGGPIVDKRKRTD
jgi:hypothetical protein